jgi:hypothetical protein
MQKQTFHSQINNTRNAVVYICHKRTGLFWGGFKYGWIQDRVKSQKMSEKEASTLLRNISYARIIR